MSRRLAFAACRIAQLALPATRKAWGEAMVAELAYAEDDRAAIGYAGGCLIAAMRERARDFDTRFAVGLWSVSLVTVVLAAVRVACAVHGARALLGGADGMYDALVRGGASGALIASYERARPIVIGCFFALGFAHFASALFLCSRDWWRFLVASGIGLLIAVLAVAIQLSVIWTADGIPSEFTALIMQAVALPALLAWSNGRHRPLRSTE